VSLINECKFGAKQKEKKYIIHKKNERQSRMDNTETPVTLGTRLNTNTIQRPWQHWAQNSMRMVNTETPVTLGTRHHTNGQYRDTGNIGYKTQYEYNTETPVTLGTRLNTNTIQRHR
jgi:Fe-S cluster biosynthesis and repair protein YggX